NQGNLGNRSVEGGLKVPYSIEVPGWDVSFQTELDLNRDQAPSGYHPEFINSVSAGRRVIGKLSCYAEFFSSLSLERNSGWVGTLDTWLTYQVSENFRLEAG